MSHLPHPLASRLQSAQHGGLMLIAAPVTLLMLFLAALAVDVARIVVTRNQLQNAADAAALAGASRLESYIQPDWQAATVAAQQAILLNRADSSQLQQAVIQTGFWPLSGEGPLRAPVEGELAPRPNENPAVRVIVRLSDGQNSGPMRFVLARLMGFADIDLAASAVAVVATPGFAAEGSLFPMVLNQCLFEQFWQDGQPIDPDQTIRIGSAYHYENCSAGQWSSLDLFSQSAKVAKTLLSEGNEAELAIDDEVFIQAGTETSIYNVVQQMIIEKGGQWDVLIPVVDSDDLSNSGALPIVAFAPFRLKASVGGNDKYIEGTFIANFKAPGTSGGLGGGGFFGATTPAILAD